MRLRNLAPITACVLAFCLIGGDALGTKEDVAAVKKRYLAVDMPLQIAQERAQETLASTYTRILTGIGTPAAKKEAGRFAASPTAAPTPSSDPKVANAQKQLARALDNFETKHAARRAALAAEYLRRLAFAGEADAAVETERKRLERALGRPAEPAGRLEIFPSGDAFARSGSFEEKNFGDEAVLGVQGTWGSSDKSDHRRISYIRFDLTGLPTAIDDARLAFIVAEHDNKPVAHHVLSACSQKNPWVEGMLDYAEHPGAIREMAKWKAPIAEGSIVYIDLTQELRDRKRQGIPDLDIRIHTDSGSAYVGYGSRENRDKAMRPRLLVNDAGVALAGESSSSIPAVEILIPDGAVLPKPEPRVARTDPKVPDSRPPRTDPDRGDSKPSAVTSGAPEKDLPLKATIAQVKALLVQQLPGGETAGFAQPLTVTAVKSGGKGAMDITFNQKVGESMQTALGAVARGLQVHYAAWPHGYTAELSFAEKYVPKDGPSAAVACALLIDGLINGDKYDPTFAVTGDLNSDLSVQPIGGVAAKLRGAKKGGAKIVAIPTANARALDDMVVLGELPALAELQVFTIERFEQARDLALTERPLKLQLAMDKFVELQRAGLANMRSESGLATLREIVDLAPNHASASQLLRAALGRAPKRLSLVGSFNTIDETMSPFIDAIRDGKGNTVADAKYAGAMHKLGRVKHKLDPRAVPLHTKLTDLIVYIRRLVDKTIGNVDQYNAALAELRVLLERLDAEYESLAADPAIVEELER